MAGPMAEPFAVDVRTVSEHLKNIFESGEPVQEATLRKFRTVQTEGSCEVTRNVDFYNLDAIISVGYRVNSLRASRMLSLSWVNRAGYLAPSNAITLIRASRAI